MRRAAMLVLFALLAAAMVFAQASANSNASPSNNGTNSRNPNGNSPSQDPQNPVWHSATGQPVGQSNQVNQSDTGAGQNNQTPNTQNGQAPHQGNSQAPNQNAGQNTTSAGANSQGVNNQNVTPNAQENSTSNGGFGQRQITPSNGGAQGQVAAGTEIHATLDTPLSTKTSKAGDRFTATIAQPVRGINGNVVIPAGTRVEGEVSEAEEGKTVAVLRGRGKLNVRFRDMLLPNGQSLPIAATLVSVHSTNGKDSKNADQEGQVESNTRGRDVAKNVGIGAGIGTVAGLLFGGPLKGLAIGALAGGGYVLAAKGKDVNLPAQTGMVIKLDQSLNASGSTSSRLQQ